jgi:hypothetical protein
MSFSAHSVHPDRDEEKANQLTEGIKLALLTGQGQGQAEAEAEPRSRRAAQLCQGRRRNGRLGNFRREESLWPSTSSPQRDRRSRSNPNWNRWMRLLCAREKGGKKKQENSGRTSILLCFAVPVIATPSDPTKAYGWISFGTPIRIIFPTVPNIFFSKFVFPKTYYLPTLQISIERQKKRLNLQ